MITRYKGELTSSPTTRREAAGFQPLVRPAWQPWPLDPSSARAHMGAMLIQTETTPNPSTLKFLPGQRVMEAGTRDFATPEDAEASPLAEAIFSTGEVEGVFFGRDFVSVTAAPGADWKQLKPQVLSVLLDH